MKILYSQIKKLVPDLSADVYELGEFFTMTGLMMDGLTEVKYDGKKDWLLGLEVRQNRPDCLSLIGLAREVSAYFALPLVLPQTEKLEPVGPDLSIKISAKEVKRVLAVQLSVNAGLPSPTWLKEYLAFYDINSINLPVDLSNYVMLVTGYTSHLLDVDKLDGSLEWKLNKQSNKVTTLDNTELQLNGQELVISDKHKILALAGLVGCQSAAISQASTKIIVEMAVYDRFIVGENSRRLAVVTEAGNRLSRDMDLAGLDYAMALLYGLLAKHAGAQIKSQIFDYYPKPAPKRQIDLDLDLVGKLSGIEVSAERSKEILENLRCQVQSGETNKLVVVPPSDRLDLLLAEDLVDEIIRFVGYDTIPPDELPKLVVAPKITARLYYLKDRVRDILSARGFDEILSQPLVATDLNEQTNYLDWQVISTQNSVNEDFPDLRQSIATGLINQLLEFRKKNLEDIKIFEIGKVFGRQRQDYQEHEALGLLLLGQNGQPALNQLKIDLEYVVKFLGLTDIAYEVCQNSPTVANPHSCFKILIGRESIGIIYKLKPLADKKEAYFAELDLSLLDKLLDKINLNPAVEITTKLIALDANLILSSLDKFKKALAEARRSIGPNRLWAMSVIDQFALADKTRYTVRVTYQELSDQEAKQLHLKVFGLEAPTN